MHKITVYAAGTDTRDQFTTPPDARQVADLVAIHQGGDAAGAGGTVAGSFNHTSSGNWVRADWGSGDKVTDDGNLNGTYDCWAPPSAFFDDFTTVFVDVLWQASWYGPGVAYEAGAQAAVRASLGAGSVEAEYNGHYVYVGHYGSYAYAHTASGVIAGVPLTSGRTVELRLFQNTGGNQTIAFRWGVRTHHAAA